MDNLTHSLVGLVAGDTASRVSRTRHRGVLVAIAVIGGNVPDLDLLYSYQGIIGDKVGYLLEHRGYTHTIVGCLALALLLYAGAVAWARFRRVSLDRSDRLAFATMALIGVMLHLAMDALNSYGVHPFWPLNNHWFYGDAVFIIEPLYWLATAPLFFLMRTMVARIVIAACVLLGLGLNFFVHSAQPLWCVGVVLVTVVLFAAGKIASQRTASYTSAGAMLAVTAMFLFAGQAAAHRAEALAARSFPGETNVDHVLSPVPSNPFCWDLLLIQTGSGEYTVRHGVISSAPALMPPQACPRIFRSNQSTAPMTPVTVTARSGADRSRVEWLGQFSMPVNRLASLAASSCEAREILQFARAPFATEVERRWVIGDLRFDREAALGMSEIELADPPPARCHYVAPWIPPRDTLLK